MLTGSVLGVAIAGALLLVAIGLGVVVQRRLAANVRARLAAIDAGRLCPLCNSAEVDAEGEVARCRHCGKTIDLRATRAQTFDAATIEHVRELPRGGRDGPR